jgi:dTDP-4-dehydrorhamnose reductase
MKVLVIGKNGQLGKSINEIVKKSKEANDFIFIGREELDLENRNDIIKYFKNNKFDIIINCAAYTEVDKAEINQKLAYQINYLSVLTLAKIIKKNNSRLIHISTDYVFKGDTRKAYFENDITNPINIYGKSKLAGERAILQTMKKNAIIIRSSWIYSNYGKNFVNTVTKLGKKRNNINIVYDQKGSPTYAKDLAKVILKIKNNETYKTQNLPSGIFHYSNVGSISWYEFAKEIFKIRKINCKIIPINSKDYISLASRPKNTSINIDKIVKQFKIKPVFWKKSLKKCLLKV